MTFCSLRPIFSPQPLAEVVAAPGQDGAALGFALALAVQGLGVHAREGAGAILWVRHETAIAETGTLYGPGLYAFGIDLSRLVLMPLRVPRDVLRAGLEGARCSALGAVVIEAAGPIDFTASRRLKLAAMRAGTAVIIVRQEALRGHVKSSTAASVRWRVRSAPAETDAPTFSLTLLKHPHTYPGQQHVVSWNRQSRTFAEALSEPVVAAPDRRPLAA